MKKLILIFFFLSYQLYNLPNASGQTDARIKLKDLICIKESDGGSGHSEPYMWTMYIYNDKRNVSTFFSTTCGQSSSSGRGNIIGNNSIKADDTVSIPWYAGSSHRETLVGTDDSIEFGVLVLLFEEDDYPNDETIEKGKQTLCDVLPQHIISAIGRFGQINGRLPEELSELDFKEIADATFKDVFNSMGIGFWDIANEIFGNLNIPDPDDYIGYGFWSAANSHFTKRETNFTIHIPHIPGENPNHEYQIKGTLTIPSVLPCYKEHENVNLFKDLINNLKLRISNFYLENPLPRGEPTQEDITRRRKAYEKLEEDLKKAQVDLEIAEDLLRKCQVRPFHLNR